MTGVVTIDVAQACWRDRERVRELLAFATANPTTAATTGATTTAAKKATTVMVVGTEDLRFYSVAMQVGLGWCLRNC